MGSSKLNVDITKCKSLESFIVVPSTFVMHVVNGKQFLNASAVAKFHAMVILSLTSPLLECNHHCSQKD